MAVKKIKDEDLDFPDEIDVFHVLPDQDGYEHELSEKCWCIPSLNYKNPELGNEIWIHRYVN